MDYTWQLQCVLDAIDAGVTEKITASELAEKAHFSVSHFSRVFAAALGMPVMLYVTRRKLAFALYDICMGKKVIDAAMEYGFETHAGFTKAFKRCFGSPPARYCLHVRPQRPQRVELSAIRNKIPAGLQSNLIIGGMIPLLVQMIERPPLAVIGFKKQFSLPQGGARHTRDVPVYWDTAQMDYSYLSRLHHLFTRSKHCEIGLFLPVGAESEEFIYLLGVGVDDESELSKVEPDMDRIDLPGGLYAVFTTPRVPEEEYPRSVRETWERIFTEWLPDAPYAFDETRPDFEYYDERDHEWLHSGTAQMDICIPVTPKTL